MCVCERERERERKREGEREEEGGREGEGEREREGEGGREGNQEKYETGRRICAFKHNGKISRGEMDRDEGIERG